MSKRELVGYCGVDSGLIWIGDPCYLKKSEFSKSEDWSGFCDSLRDIKLPIENNSGVLTQSGYGDGQYPVYVTKDKEGYVKKMEIVF
jgi:hypothetical protein